MHKPNIKAALSLLIAAILAAFLICACRSESITVDERGENDRVAGTWVLKARSTEGIETPATERLIKLHLKPDGTFTAAFKGEPNQSWITAGQGGFSYVPPVLSLYWDNGASVTFLVAESQSDQMRLHRGRNLAPLKEQEPDEIFVRRQVEKGPTKKPS